MELDDRTCYEALRSRDDRFDGVFFVGVSSTGIYCRTVCTAKTPRRENCAFFPSAAAAERAGYRPCLRCRPELAPGNARVDAAGWLAATAASRIEDLSAGSVDDLAATLGVSARHLRRVVEREFGVSPVALAQTQRLLTAKRLLCDTALPITEIAFSSGFSSVRRFNALFQTRYGLTPGELRAKRPSNGTDAPLVCELAYRPPLDWEALLGFLRGRCCAGVEAIDGCQYLRTVRVGSRTGYIIVTPQPDRNRVRVELSAPLAGVVPQVLTRVKHLFDLNAHPRAVSDKLGALAASRPGMRVPGAFDGFEMAVRAILGQQVSVRVATTLAGRLVSAFGEPFETPHPGLSHLTPDPKMIAAAEIDRIRSLGITAPRAAAVLALAREVSSGAVSLEPTADIDGAMERLRRLPGFGEWTCQYIAMRALRWPDAFPHTDLWVKRALQENDPRRVLQIAEAWRPWRAYATMHLWQAQTDAAAERASK